MNKITSLYFSVENTRQHYNVNFVLKKYLINDQDTYYLHILCMPQSVVCISLITLYVFL